MNENEIVFKSEDSMWQMLASGEKTFDARRWDIDDPRIVRLARGHWVDYEPATRTLRALGNEQLAKAFEQTGAHYEFDEPHVCFLNKATGEIQKFRFQGLNFLPWAPGWCFMELGGIVERKDSKGLYELGAMLGHSK